MSLEITLLIVVILLFAAGFLLVVPQFRSRLSARQLNRSAARRRMMLQAALKYKTLKTTELEQLLKLYLQPPELTPEDIDLFYKVTDLAISLVAKSRGKNWDQVDVIGAALSQLDLSGETRHDLVKFYTRLAQYCEQNGDRSRAIALAQQGCDCPQGVLSSRVNCALVLARNRAVDARTARIYKTFLTSDAADSPEVGDLLGLIKTSAAIQPDVAPGNIQPLLDFNTFLLQTIPADQANWVTLNLGMGHLMQGKLSQAQAYFQAVLAKNAADLDARLALVITLLRGKQYGEALNVVELARRESPNKAALKFAAAFCQVVPWFADVTGKTGVTYQQLEEWQNDLRSKFPLRALVTPQIDLIQGCLAAALGEWPNAGDHLRTACEASPGDALTAYYYAQWLQLSGDWKAAAAVLTNKHWTSAPLLCLELNQARHDATLGSLNENIRKYIDHGKSTNLNQWMVSAKYALITGQGGAIPAWNEPIPSESPDLANEWHLIWIRVLIARGDVSAARQAMEHEQFSHIPLVERLLLSAVLEWTTGETDKARTALETVIGLVPNNENALRLQATICEARGDLRGTLTWLELLHKVSPNDHAATLRLALVKARKDDVSPAKTLLMTLIDLPDVGPSANYWFARLILASKQTNAEDLLRAAKGLQAARKAGFPNSEWFYWLCQARLKYDSKKGWSASEARALLDELPGKLLEIPIPEVAAVAALVAVETGQVGYMLDGARCLLGAIAQHAAQQADTKGWCRDLLEVLWRIAVTATSARNRSELFDVMKQAQPYMQEYAQEIGELLSVMTLSKAISQVRANKDLDEALEQVEAELRANPGSLLADVARISILVKQGQLAAQDAISRIREGHQAEIAHVANKLIMDGEGESIAQPGLVAFLVHNRPNLPDLPATLRKLAEQAVKRHDRALLSEIMLCNAITRLNGESITLAQDGYETNMDMVIADRLGELLYKAAGEPRASASMDARQIVQSLNS